MRPSAASLELTEDGNIAVCWQYKNSSKTQEMPSTSYYIYYGSNVIELTEEPQQEKTYNFVNSVNETQQFTYSEDQYQSAQAEAGVTVKKSDFSIKKSYSNYSPEMGEPELWSIILANSTALPYTELTVIKDNMPAMLYITAEDMQTMFDTDAANTDSVLSIEIKDATLCTEKPSGTVTGADGQEHELQNATTGVNTQYSGMESTDSVDTASATLLLDWGEDGLLQLSVDGAVKGSIGEGGIYATIAEALESVGFLVTRSTCYYPVWTFSEDFVLWGGQTVRYQIPSRVKDSFMYLSQDAESTAISGSKYGQSTNLVYAYYTDENGVEKYKIASSYVNIYRDFALYKSAAVNGENIEEDAVLSEGDIISHSISLQHTGNGSYDALPLVDHLQGGQVLLVPAEQNSVLGEQYGLIPEMIDGVSCYVLDKPGVYENVVIGGILADSVTVTKSESGLNTLIRWYLTDINKTITKNISYDALISPTRAGSEGVSYVVNNEVWAGDHQSHRLYDSTGVWGSRLSFDKSIVSERGTVPEQDALEEYCPVSEGETVLYRFAFQSDGDSSFTLTGSHIYDMLPASVEEFWEEADIEIEYVSGQDADLEVSNGDHWYVTTDSPDDIDRTDQQYLRWQDDFSMKFTGTVYIYVKLTFPEESLWQSYGKKYANTRLENDLVVYDMMDTVYHDLDVAAEAILQKGVYFTGMTSGYYYSQENGTESRWYYSNDDAYNRLVSYYVTLYNSGDNKLYLNDMQDILPKGFTFLCMYTSAGTVDMQTSATCKTNFAATVKDQEVSSTVCKGFTVGAVTEELADGRQKITFSVSGYTANPSQSILYDDAVGKYYLEPGTGIQFAYICRTNTVEDTEDVATNQIVMPYCDTVSSEITLPDNVTITGKSSNDIKANDGGCEILNQEEAESAGFTDDEASYWLSSDVTLTRGEIVPGITKSVRSVTKTGGTTVSNPTYADILDTINWSVTVTNEGYRAIADYTVTDVMQAAYQFTGDVVYTIYYPSSQGYYVTATIFTITERSGDTLSVKDGKGTAYTLTPDGPSVTVNARIYHSGTSGNSYVQTGVTLETDENGNEVLKLHFADTAMNLPAGGQGVLQVSTKNEGVHENKVFYNTAYLTPNSQIYDAGAVTQGNNTEVDGKPSVRNSCPITVSFGYVTGSEKEVTQAEDETNTASGSDEINYIVLPEEDDLFNFTLRVSNTTDKAMSKLVLIDNLPEPGDHSTFVNTEPRYSEFRISLADEPDFTVTVTRKDGTVTALTEEQYTLEFSDRTEFTGEDWNAESAWESEPDEDTRSFRIVILDDEGTLIPAESEIAVQFTAKIDGEASQHQTAWNSFGYHYRLKDVAAELEAAPMKVGVRIPSVPQIRKQLKLKDGTAFAAEEDQSFRFLIYEGEAITLPSGYTEADLAQSLKAAGRKFTFVTLNVLQGQSASELLLLEDWPCFDFVDGSWTETEEIFSWVNGTKYTVMELALIGQDEFSYYSINGSLTDGYTITYNHALSADINCVNRRKTWEFRMKKTDAKTGAMLSGAVFGLYSPYETDQISSEAYDALDIEPDKSITVSDKVYYLSEVQSTDESGWITWTGLLRAGYYLRELQAPPGYCIEDTPIPVESSGYEDLQPVTVTNTSGYRLPDSGGAGVYWYTASGMLLMAAALLLYILLRRRKEDYWS